MAKAKPKPHLQIPLTNGGVGACNAYWWTQTLEDCTVHVPLPAWVRGKDVTVDLRADRIRVAYKGQGQGGSTTGGSVVVLDGRLHAPVRTGSDADAAFWTLDALPAGSPSLRDRPIDVTLPPFAHAPSTSTGSVAASTSLALDARRSLIHSVLCALPEDQRALFTGPCKLLTVTLGKVTPTWWLCVLQGTGTGTDHDPLIDGTRVDSSQPVEAYDAETQAAIRRILYDQTRKAAGLPTSEEERTQDVLAAAMAVPGSPFSTASTGTGTATTGSGGGGSGLAASS